MWSDYPCVEAAGAPGNRYGHRRTTLNGKRMWAHRAAWIEVHGPIPTTTPATCVCHHCDNPACIEPEHLFLGSRADNMKDMWAKGRGRGDGIELRGGPQAIAARTHCKNGHEYTSENTHIRPGTNTRRCRKCEAEGNLRRKRSTERHRPWRLPTD